jgi:hypothetical protein
MFLKEKKGMEFARYFKMRNILQAFTVRDVQMVAVLMDWAASNGFEPTEVVDYAKISPNFVELERLGYFSKAHNPEQLRTIRQFEKLLPRDFRREARKVRLENSYTGVIKHG